MSQCVSRLFEKWLDAGGDLTYGEWLAERRASAERHRQQRALYGQMANFMLAQHHLAEMQSMRPQQISQFAGFIGGGLVGIFGR